ncbi:Succinate dehydrogenase iron-sulfur protein (EC 1.3.5.1) [uncultured Gammaproteobacteria bacterium]|uniref:succinate dehydrogenase/fumarate reductase iron-sulfur subunit n=1 Tax=Bathymodiolus heckerae thiotrophic gill symbiont TaxID=1052212 RepID=UPI0010B2B526|nr:succinate dehydrogenase/fumarate reductase iron-sulfur subunit [Bathymodiolus heckerae thiotrophic gill symbiont]CAC9537042.1 Succinate dehydrogenase iron-sulfur protein (EC 1.3.5.1) [uncultured Gammaproteobacteria bacterium]CAC9582155.1 Succinate dehydrogenase iron-sulfur protein (EC 1.3.5.1) [uncultured Gammaproteobacteria bacterium]CAC9953485.1 Succinate dehydrogenase iron-sulfur protein (EC 1.3.5.1) [uncultured Gammaproteobacteria bacterium]SHN91307.1 Succinate dehydrogenase iron-sulfur 
MIFTLHIWRQKSPQVGGSFSTYIINNIDGDTSFLEMLDQLNEQLIHQNEDCIVFDYDCREGICGACSLVINGYPHGEKTATTTCQLYMREYKNETELWIEPWRANSFAVLKDLTVDRSAFDRIIQSGGYVSVHTGSAPEANNILVEKNTADEAFSAAECIGCGACVAVCPNASASLFVAAKISHLMLLPQGEIESNGRAHNMMMQMQDEGFGSCSNHRYCERVCPKGISLQNITRMNNILG